MKSLGNDELMTPLCAHFETVLSLPPLTSRLLAYLIIEVDSSGITFDHLIQVFEVSKSSMSHSINQLLELDKIDFIYKEDQRKRYFRPNPHHFENRLLEISENLEKEYIFFQEIYNYRKENKKDSTEHVQKLGVYRNYILQQKSILEQTLTELKKITKIEK